MKNYYVFARNGVYTIKWKGPDGRWVHRSLGTRDKKEAQRYALMFWSQRAQQLRQSAPPEEHEVLPLDRARDLYLEWAVRHLRPQTVVSRKSMWKLFLSTIPSGIRSVEDVTRTTVEAWKRQCVENGCAASTLQTRLVTLQGIWSTLKEQGWTTADNPFRGVRVARKSHELPRWLTTEEIALLLAEARKAGSRDMELFIALGVYAGLRKGEANHARWEWIDWDRGVITVQNSNGFTTKSGKPRPVPLASRLREILEPYRQESGYIIAPQYLGRNLDPMKLRKMVRALGLEWVHPHTLRHTFASHLAQAGVSLYKVARWMGHQSLATTMIYSHLCPVDAEIDKGFG